MASSLLTFINELKGLLLQLAPRLNELVLESSSQVQTTLIESEVEEQIETYDSSLVRVANKPRKTFKCSSLDSSSRSLSFRGVRLFVSGAVVSTPLGLLTIPRSTTRVPFVAVKSYSSVLAEIESLANSIGIPLLVRSPAGYLYSEDEGYKDDNINDELRLVIENYALTEAGGEEVDYVLLDGPVVPTPPLLLYPSGESKYKEAFEKLLLGREGRVHVLRSSNDPVLGVVKRCDESKKLIRCEEIREVLINMGYKASRAPDTVIVDLIASEYYREKLTPSRRPIVIGPLKAEYRGVLPTKVFWYVWIPCHGGPTMYRLEVLEEHFEKFNHVDEIVTSIIHEACYDGLPVKIRLVDHFAKRLTTAIYRQLAWELSPFLTLTYDERLRLVELSSGD